MVERRRHGAVRWASWPGWDSYSSPSRCSRWPVRGGLGERLDGRTLAASVAVLVGVSVTQGARIDQRPRAEHERPLDPPLSPRS